jgi:preprotein translocase subunit SecG
MLKILLTLLHVIVSVVLILVVLLQTGKRADLAGAFGGGGSQTAFGARGAATLLSKATTASAVIFMITSLSLSLLTAQGTDSGTVLDQIEVPEPDFTTAPAVPGEPVAGEQEQAPTTAPDGEAADLAAPAEAGEDEPQKEETPPAE